MSTDFEVSEQLLNLAGDFLRSRESVNANTNSSMTSGSQSNHETGHCAKRCGGCGVKIVDRYMLHAADRYWHQSCLKCNCCQATLGDFGSCFVKSGMIFCRNDYFRLFQNGSSCGTCGQTISAGELVMKAGHGVYHVKCFNCVKCRNRLMPGDRYSIMNGSLLCEQDSNKCLKEQ